MKKNVRVAGFLLIVCFLPFLRSCGDVSVGFPVVAFSGKGMFSIGAVNITGLAINISFMIAMCLIVILILRQWTPGPVADAGIKGILFYHILILTGYLVSYPLYERFTNRFMEYVAGIHLYLLYPLHELLDFESLDRVSSDMKIFGDIFDIRFRIHYMLMVMFWFGAGCLIAYIRLHRKKNSGVPEVGH